MHYAGAGGGGGVPNRRIWEALSRDSVADGCQLMVKLEDEHTQHAG